VGRDVSKSLRINSHASIFTAELVALNLSLDIIRRSKRKKFAIFSDLLSSLLAINNRHLETGYVQKFITDYSQLSNSGKTIIIIWIPSHTGIRGNELVDEAAKSALNLSMSAVKCPATDLYSDVANHCQRLWQAEWDGCVSNKLHSVKPLLGYSNLSNLSRQDAVVLRRLRIGHTRLTHSYLLNRQDQPECSYCDCALTVAHVLLECNHYNVVRQRYFNVFSLHELFDTVNAQNILGFIRDIGLYRLL